MKKLLLTLLSLAVILPQSQAQADISPTFSGPKNILKINPLSIFLLTGNVQYERVLTPHLSLQAGFFATGARFDLMGVGKFGYRALSLTPEVRYYIPGEGAQGFYVGGYLRLQQFRTYGNAETTIYDPVNNTTVNGKVDFIANANNLGIGGVLGGQFILGRGFVIDLYAGLGGNLVRTKIDITAQTSDGTVDEDFSYRAPLSPVSLRLGLSLGWAFGQ